MPTALPRARRVENKKPSFVSVLFNAFLVLSAVLLTFVVLVREEQYAFGQTHETAQTVEIKAPRNAPDMTGETMAVPPE